jgi:membrane protease YdiL (CAAX protease family)
MPITLLPTEGLPAYSIFLNILAITAVAGISEEVGFRGYMQKPIENKLGNKAAILITSLFFTLAHLGHAEFNYVLPVYFFFSVVMGIVALHTNSLLPSIILHFVFDFAVFNSFWLLGKEAVTSQISVTGISTGYILLIAGFVIGLTGGIIFWKKLVAEFEENYTTRIGTA